MKTRNILKFLLVFGLFSMSFVSCSDDDLEPIDTLFRPNFRSPVVTGNTIQYTWYVIDGAVGYNLEISRDTFKTIDRTVSLTENRYVFENLKYATRYQVRAMALSADPADNSAWGEAPDTRTASRIVPNVLYEVEKAELSADEVTLRWNTGYTVTRILIASTAEGSSYEQEIRLTPADIANGYVTAEGLTAKTDYRATIYNDNETEEDLRPWNSIRFTTTAQMPEGAYALDLGDDLAEFIANDEGPRILFLPDGYEYEFTSGVTITKDIAIYGENRTPIVTTAQWAISGTVGTIHLEGLDFTGVGSNQYIFNSSAAFDLDKLEFVDCQFDNYQRSLFRIQGGAGTQITNYILIDNCIFTCPVGNNYEILYCTVDSPLNSAIFRNSTFYNSAMGLIRWDKMTTSINMTIENCTFYNFASSQRFVRIPVSVNATTNVINCLFTNATISDMIQSTGTINGVDCYATSDFSMNNNQYAIPVTRITSSATAADLFVDPDNGDLTIKDGQAADLKVGDPRWLP